MQAYGHFDCGVYAEVISGGVLSEGGSFTLERETQEVQPAS
jgi:uncharacterized protein